VDYLDFYVGGMPALAPPRISSIANMRIRNGSFTNRRHQIDLNMSGLGFIAEGPFPDKKASYLLNVRFNDLHVLEPFLDIGGVPQYGDSHLKVTCLIDESHSLSLTGVFGFDILKQNSTSWAFPTNWTEKLFQSGVGANWQTNKKAFKNNLHGSFSFRNEEYFEEIQNFSGSKLVRESTWDTMYSPPVSIPYKGDTITLGMEKGNSYDRFAKEEMFGTVDNRWHILLKDKFSFYARDEDQLDIGIRAKRSNFNLSERSGRERGWINMIYSDTLGTELVDSNTSIDTTFLLDSSTTSDEIGGYVQYIFTSGNFKCVAGVRADYWRLLRDYGISPRIGMSYKVPRVGTFSFSGGLYYQDPADLSGYLSDIMVPNPNWNAPRPKLYEIELQRNWQAVFGYERELPNSHHVAFESYYKLYDREYPLVDPDRYEYQDSYWDAYWDNKPWSFPKPTGKKKAYGLELSFKKRKQTGLYYSLAYSLFSVKNRYADKSWYDDKNNLRNTLSGTLGIKFRKFHSLAFRVYAAEGRPYSLAVTDSLGRLKYDKSLGYYSGRLDPLCSMNVRYSFNISRHWGNVTGYLEVWNFLNYTPVVEKNKGYREYYETNTNGLIPILGFSVDF
jgi:hypothetical protein